MLSRVDRAKQFLPFDALKGLQNALREKEVEYVDKIELAEEKVDEISLKLQSIKIGDNISIIYYSNSQYRKSIGNVFNINILKRYIIVNNIQINFIDILSIDNIEKLY